MTPDALAHLANEPGLTLCLSAMGPSFRDDARWYAAFRDSENDELTPERGWGYGPTPDEAIAAAVASFRATEEENAA